MKISLLLSSILIGLSFNSFAAQVKTLKVQEEVVINAPASKVWDKANNFGDLGAWHPAVKKTEILSGTNNKKGAIRLLTLQDGGTIKEKLHAYNTKSMSYQYEIVEGVLPVSHYVSTISVSSKGENQTIVTWKGKFKRKDMSASPATGQDDEAAVKTITGVYRGGLDNLKKITE
ncbi:MAG: SRPBCC family protein [Glaciimonas sp.]|nr:SRPBCC family protein [Glaciimonas sp.]